MNFKGNGKIYHKEIGDPAIFPLGIHSKEYKPIYNRDACQSIFITALFTTTKI
jgi:hypothetical protein